MDMNILKHNYPILHSIINDYYGIDIVAKYDIDELILDKIGNAENNSNYWKK